MAEIEAAGTCDAVGQLPKLSLFEVIPRAVAGEVHRHPGVGDGNEMRPRATATGSSGRATARSRSTRTRTRPWARSRTSRRGAHGPRPEPLRLVRGTARTLRLLRARQRARGPSRAVDLGLRGRRGRLPLRAPRAREREGDEGEGPRRLPRDHPQAGAARWPVASFDPRHEALGPLPRACAAYGGADNQRESWRAASGRRPCDVVGGNDG